MTLDARRAGDAIAISAAELARLWRSARAAACPDVFPGTIDGIVEQFFALAGRGLAEGRDPALTWTAISGVVRVHGRDAEQTTAELAAEWDIAEHVLHAACRALDAGDAARDWMSRAVETGRMGTQELPRSGPPGVLTVHLLSGGHATRARAPEPR